MSKSIMGKVLDWRSRCFRVPKHVCWCCLPPETLLLKLPSRNAKLLLPKILIGSVAYAFTLGTTFVEIAVCKTISSHPGPPRWILLLLCTTFRRPLLDTRKKLFSVEFSIIFKHLKRSEYAFSFLLPLRLLSLPSSPTDSLAPRT